MLFICSVHFLASKADATQFGVAPIDSTIQKKMDAIEISLLTCAPHDEVYSLYGHTAIRIQNHDTGEDLTVNYGVFDTTVDNFVIRFVFGLTDYMMGIFRYSSFRQEYRYYGCEVHQQRLNMNATEKLRFMRAIAENSRPENVVYRYNYFYDNCTTHARDILLDAFEADIKYKPTKLQEGKLSFRDLIHMKNENNRWSRLGNDLLLGVAADFNTNVRERQFLPEVLMDDFDAATVSYADGTSKKLVDSSFCVIPPGEPYHSNDPAPPFSPFVGSLILACVILAVIFVSYRTRKKAWGWVEYAICCLYAIPGILIFAMIFSQHPTVQVNLQILIFNPALFLLAYSRFHWKWRWHLVAACTIVFFIGGFIQSYAEGMYTLALILLVLSLKNIRIEKEQ